LDSRLNINQIAIIHLRRVYKLTYLHTHFMNKFFKKKPKWQFFPNYEVTIYMMTQGLNITSEKTKGQVSLS
jgi:hypothetical protein